MYEDRLTLEALGNVSEGRPNLGPQVRVETYRLVHFAIRAVLERSLGREEAARLLYEAGVEAGRMLARDVIGPSPDLASYARQIQEKALEMGIGLVRFEKTDLEAGEIVLTVAEDLDCSGVEEAGEPICTFDEGLIAGLLGDFTGRRFDVREIDCWATGGRMCRFRAVAVDA
jgi:predicted hydrocarbon binding protein